MVREVVEVLKCDVDRTRDARTWTVIDPDGNAVELDLCDIHARPIAKLHAQGHTAVARPAPRKRTPRAQSRVEVIDV